MTNDLVRMTDILKVNGYQSSKGSYKKITKENTHCVKISTDCIIQMYGYMTADSENGGEYEKIYNTGRIAVTISEFEMLLELFNDNHN